MSETSQEPIRLPWVHVVLARPSEPRNVGAACRAMKNFGITRLSIVTGETLDYESARPLAVHADDLLERARVVPTLAEAVEGASLVAGTTRRLGQKRKSVSLMPWEFAARTTERFAASSLPGDDNDADSASGGELAVVFGNEQSGLSDEELLECHVAVSIPTSPLCPSLNLSHAVEVICYELYKSAMRAFDTAADGGHAGGHPPGIAGAGVATPIAAAHADAIVRHLDALRFRSQEGPQGMRIFMRDLIARAGLSYEEAERFERLFAKLAGMHGR
ncbi:MAG: RNA methyltransferase [Spirochaetota bacterium]